MIELHDIRYGKVLVSAFSIKSVICKNNHVEVYVKNQSKLIVTEDYDTVNYLICSTIDLWEKRKFGGM